MYAIEDFLGLYVRKPICDIVFCVINFDVLTFYFCILCIMLHVLNGAIHEVEPRWRRGESISIVMHPP